MMRYITILLIFIMFCCIGIYAQTNNALIEFSASVDSREVYPGDRINYSLSVYYPSGYKVDLELGQLVENLDVINIQKPDPEWDDARERWHKQLHYEIAVFYLDDFTIPPGICFVTSPDNTTNILITQKIDIAVLSMLSNNISNQTLRDIKDIASVEPDYTLIVVLILFVIIIAVGLYLYKRYFSNKAEAEKEILPHEPPESVARRRLRLLAEHLYIEKKQWKKFYTELSDILREYLNKRYAIVTFERTSDEIITQIKTAYIEETVVEYIEKILIQADLVKFAKRIPSPNEAKSDFSICTDIIDTTAMQTDEAPETHESVIHDTQDEGGCS